jgi:hypothetical protein
MHCARWFELVFSGKWLPHPRTEGGHVEQVLLGGFDIHLLIKIPVDWFHGTFA